METVAGNSFTSLNLRDLSINLLGQQVYKLNIRNGTFPFYGIGVDAGQMLRLTLGPVGPLFIKQWYACT